MHLFPKIIIFLIIVAVLCTTAIMFAYRHIRKTELDNILQNSKIYKRANITKIFSFVGVFLLICLLKIRKYTLIMHFDIVFILFLCIIALCICFCAYYNYILIFCREKKLFERRKSDIKIDKIIDIAGIIFIILSILSLLIF